MMAIYIAVGVVLGTVLAELLHGRRVRRVARLAFGPTGEPRSWTRWVPATRAAALGLLAWGLVTLWGINPKVHRPHQLPEGGYRHVVIVLDVSPSMQLRDAGPTGQQTRMQRAGEILMSVLKRIAIEQVRVSVVAFYTAAKPVVVDTFDLEVVKNILNDLPLDQAFSIGKTLLIEGIKEGATLAKPWQPNSTTMILVSDGDTVPDFGMPVLPKSINKVLVVGVGNPRVGKFIDGHQSRQDASTLRQVALRMGGTYHDGNEKHLPSEQLKLLAEALPMKDASDKGKRELALAATGTGAALLALIPVALAIAGSSWQAGHRKARSSGTARSVPSPSTGSNAAAEPRLVEAHSTAAMQRQI
jgi:Ca-activated chloride channel homolog